MDACTRIKRTEESKAQNQETQEKKLKTCYCQLIYLMLFNSDGNIANNMGFRSNKFLSHEIAYFSTESRIRHSNLQITKNNNKKYF